MGMLATMAGYEKGEALPGVTVCCLEGSYLVLVDLRALVKPENVEEFVQSQCHLGVDYGEWFGENYKGFIRLNLATDPALVKKAVKNIISAAQAAGK